MAGMEARVPPQVPQVDALTAPYGTPRAPPASAWKTPPPGSRRCPAPDAWITWYIGGLDNLTGWEMTTLPPRRHPRGLAHLGNER